MIIFNKSKNNNNCLNNKIFFIAQAQNGEIACKIELKIAPILHQWSK